MDTQSSEQEICSGVFLDDLFIQALSAKIVVHGASGNVIEAAPPFLGSAIVGIDVLDVIDISNHMLTSRQTIWATGAVHSSGSGSQRLLAIGAENNIDSPKRFGHGADMHLISLLQNKICAFSGEIPANQNGRLLLRKTALARLAGRTTQPLFSAALRLKKMGFIGFGNAHRASRLLTLEQSQKSGGLSKCRVGLNANRPRTYADVLSISQLFLVTYRISFVTKSGRQCAGRGIEGRSVGAAEILLQSRGTQAGNTPVRATQIGRLLGHSGFSQLLGRRHLHVRLRSNQRHLLLMRFQILQLTRKLPETTRTSSTLIQ